MVEESVLGPVTISVVVLTFRREDLLSRLLPELVRQVSDVGGPSTSATVVVIDNDPDASAQHLVTASSQGVHYRHEPTPGLSAARNRALDEAGAVDALIFIDDDETPGEGWLRGLLATWHRAGAAAVTGPVRSLTPHDTDPWILGTGLFTRRTRATDSPMKGLATNNLLLDMAFVRAHGLRFDPRFGMTGGEDSKFGQDLLAAGGSIVWCDEAEVSEGVPADRLTRSWVRRRLTRTGESWVRVRVIDLPAQTSLVMRARYFVKGAAKCVVGLACAAWFHVLRSPRGQGRAVAEWAGGFGMMRGALGVNWEEYRRG